MTHACYANPRLQFSQVLNYIVYSKTLLNLFKILV